MSKFSTKEMDDLMHQVDALLSEDDRIASRREAKRKKQEDDFFAEFDENVFYRDAPSEQYFQDGEEYRDNAWQQEETLEEYEALLTARQAKSQTFNAYNADFKKVGREKRAGYDASSARAGKGTRNKASSAAKVKERPEKQNAAQTKRMPRNATGKKGKKKKKHRILKWILGLLLLFAGITALLFIFAKQPIAEDSIGARKAGCSTILVAGTDEDGVRTDTMMLLYLDSKNHEMNLMSLPRDTYIQADYSVPKLNSVYGVNNGGKEGMEALCDYVEQLIGYPPDAYMVIDLDCFVDLVNLMGGVTFDVPCDMDYTDPTQDLYIDLKQGEQKLNGEEAMWLVRFRSGYAAADLQRVQVQRDFISAAMDQWLSVKNLPKAPAAAILVATSTKTDMSIRNLFWIAKAAKLAGTSNMQTYTLPGEARTTSYGSFYYANPYEIVEVVNQYFNPYEQDITVDDLSVGGW